MMDSIIRFSLNQRWLVCLAAFLIAVLGAWNALRLPVDAVPDITNIQVQINTAAPSYSPLEVEQRITFAVENAMAGLPQLEYTRSLSRYGLSQVTVVFLEGTDIYWARQQISERLQSVRAELPAGLEPMLGPLASGLGEVFTYGVTASPGALKPDGGPYSLENLRTIQDWIIRPQLLKVPGVTEVNGMGGYVREYEVAPEPLRLLAFHLTVDDVITTLERNNSNAGAGYIERNGEQWLVRSPGQLTSIEDIRQLVIAMRNEVPVRVGDVATVSFGKELRTGTATLNGEETVLGTAFMLLGANSRTVARDIAARLDEINTTLPDGVQATALYDRSSLVDSTIRTVRNNLFEGAILVMVVLFALLGNFRAALIAALVIPHSLLFGFTGMTTGRVSGNLMSLGAIDFGLIVDGAVIIVENAVRRLGVAQQRLGRTLSLEERLEEVFQGTREVFRPAVFGVLI
ncbi:MAG: efflux RND transporter permease subunit, partial [Pseudomonas sp.]